MVIEGIFLGFGAGLVFWYLVAVRPMTKDFIRLRYDGLRPEAPMPRAKTLPPSPRLRED